MAHFYIISIAMLIPESEVISILPTFVFIGDYLFKKVPT